MILILTFMGILCIVQVFALPLPITTERSYKRIVLNDTDDGNGKQMLEERSDECHLMLSTEDTIKAKQTFQQGILTDENVFAFYIYLSKPKNITKGTLGKYIANDEDGNKWNGLQEWFWVKEDMRYYTLNLPIDLDALTFKISKYGTKNIDIGWTLAANCNKDNTIAYKNETDIILNYIWTNIIGNQTDSYICHRNFKNDIDYLELIWLVTSIWVGYDFDCYEVNSLKEGIKESVLISKNDLTKLLAFAVCVLGFMHPFIWYIFESIQIQKERDIFTYYKDVIDSEKPYGIVRCMRKCLYPGKRNTETENTVLESETPATGDMIEYVPIFRFFIVITFIIFSMNLYKLNDMKHEMFKHNGYSEFPKVYRFGIPLYNTRQFHLVVIYVYIILSAIVYCISNSWVYTLYNDSDDFIICIPYDIFNGKYVIPMKTFTMLTCSKKEKKDPYSFRASQKLIFRFTMIFNIRFWRFIVTYSMCGLSLCCFKKDNWYKCLFFTLYKIFCGPLLIAINLLINGVFCSLPALWFILFIPLRMAGYGSTKSSTNSTDKCSLFTLFSYFFKLLLYILYLFTLRQQAAFFIFIIRCCFYTIIVGFTGTDRVWRIYITVVASFTYFMSYMNGFVNSYKVLLKTVFKISKRGELDERTFNHIIDNCYSVQKRLFFLVVKTTLTIVFLSVTFLILRETGKFDNSKYLNNFVSYLMVLISPKLVSIFSQTSPGEDVKKQESNISELLDEEQETQNQKQENEKDYCWQTFKYPFKYLDKSEKFAKCLHYVSCECCSKFCQVVNAVIWQFHLSTDDREILTLDDTIFTFEAGSTFLPCCKPCKNIADDPVQLITDIEDSL